jgi:alkylation response protein AidB-like acyl-CoA dehydrogenase
MEVKFFPQDEQYRLQLRAWLEADVPQEPPPADPHAAFEYRRAWPRKLYEGGEVGIHWPKA